VTEAARLVHDLDDLVDVRVEEARVLGVRDHQAGRPLGDRGPDRLRLRISLLPRIDRDDLVSGRGRSGAVAGVGEDRRDDLVSLTLSACSVVGTHHACVRVHPLRAPARLEREATHPRDLAEHPLELVEDLQHSLDGLVVLERMQLGDVRGSDELLVHLWAVLHGARAEPEVDVDVGSQGLLRKAQVVA
jgi:hypothetical protein